MHSKIKRIENRELSLFNGAYCESPQQVRRGGITGTIKGQNSIS